MDNRCVNETREQRGWRHIASGSDTENGNLGAPRFTHENAGTGQSGDCHGGPRVLVRSDIFTGPSGFSLGHPSAEAVCLRLCTDKRIRGAGLRSRASLKTFGNPVVLASQPDSRAGKQRQRDGGNDAKDSSG